MLNRVRAVSLTLFLFLSALLPAKDTTEDSLLSRLALATHDTMRFALYEKLADHIFMDNPYRTIDYTLKALQITGDILESGPSPELKDWAESKRAGALNNLGYLYNSTGKMDLAIDYYFRAIKMYEEQSDTANLSSVFNNIGGLYMKMGKYEEAGRYFRRCFEEAVKTRNKRQIARGYHNLGSLSKRQGELDTALMYYDKSLALRKEIGDSSGISLSLNNIAHVYMQRKEYDRAKQLFHEVRAIQTRVNEKENTILVQNNLGRVNFLMGLTDSALFYYLKSYSMYDKFRDPGSIATTTKGLFEIYERKGDYKQAMKYYMEYRDQRDSAFSAEIEDKASAKDLEYQFEKEKIAFQLEQEKKEAVAAEEARIQAIIRYILIGGFIAVLVFAFFVYRSYQRKKKDNILISEQKLQVESQKKEIIDSITYAKRIQEALLPDINQISRAIPGVFVLYQPKDIVAGDFYWFEKSGDRSYLAVCDCTGHGVPGAMVSVVGFNALNRAFHEFGLRTPASILDKVNELVLETFARNDKELKDGMDVAMLSLYDNNGVVTVEYAGANNPLWVVRTDGTFSETKANKQPIGAFLKPQPFLNHTLGVRKGDSIYIFSDGYADQFGGGEGKKLKTANLRKLLLSIAELAPDDQHRKLEVFFSDWKRNYEQVDDVCIAGIKL